MSFIAFLSFSVSFQFLLCLSIRKQIFSQSQSKINAFDSFEKIFIITLNNSWTTWKSCLTNWIICESRFTFRHSSFSISLFKFFFSLFVFRFSNSDSNAAAFNQETRVTIEKTFEHLEIWWRRISVKCLKTKSYSANAH
jgi:hypothetical protein